MATVSACVASQKLSKKSKTKTNRESRRKKAGKEAAGML